MSDAERLVACARGCGFEVVLGEHGTALRKVRRNAVLTDVLRAELTAHRDAIAAYLDAESRKPPEPTETVHCPECNATVYVWDNDRDMAFTACKGSGLCNVQCPFWRRGLTEEWWGRDRWFAQKRREQVQRVNDDDVPE